MLLWKFYSFEPNTFHLQLPLTYINSICFLLAGVMLQNTGRSIMYSRMTKIYYISGHIWTLQLWLMPQLQNTPTFIFQQDGSPAHFHCEVRQYLNTVLPGRWIGCASGNDQPMMHTSNISSCQKKLFQFSCVCEQFH
jgi:hypothetical protein